MPYNTGNPVPSTDPRDFKDNVENVDKAVNNTGTWTDRLGVSRDTLPTIFDNAQSDADARYSTFDSYVSEKEDQADTRYDEFDSYISGKESTADSDIAAFEANLDARLPDAISQYSALTSRGAWATGTAYKVNDLWSYDGNWYFVPADYTSGATAQDDIDNGDAVAHRFTGPFRVGFPSLSEAVVAVTSSPSEFPFVETASRYSEAECASYGIDYPCGGGALYEVVPSGTGVADGGSFIDAGTVQLKLVTPSSGFVSALVFGMVGNNVDDDSSALQNALNYAANSANKRNNASTVIIPAGKYAIANVDVPQNIVVQGEGRNATRLYPHASAVGGYMIRLVDNHSGIKDCGFFHDRSFSVNALEAYAAGGINRWLIIQNLFFESIKGFAIKFNNTVWVSDVVDCFFRVCGDTGNEIPVVHVGSNASGDATNNLSFIRCKFFAYNWYAIYAYGEIGNRIRKLNVKDCFFHGGVTEGDINPGDWEVIWAENIVMLNIDNNTLTNLNNTYNDIMVVGDPTGEPCENIRVVNNSVEGRTLDGQTSFLTLRDVDGAIMDGNIFGISYAGYHINVDSTVDNLYVGPNLTSGGGFFTTGIPSSYATTENLRLASPVITGTPKFNSAENFRGNVSVTSATSVTVSLPNTEPNSVYGAFCGFNFNSGNWWISGKTTTSFNINWTNSGTGSIYWELVRG